MSNPSLRIVVAGLRRLVDEIVQTDEAVIPRRSRVPLAPPFTSISRAHWLRAFDLWRAHGAAMVAAQPPRPCPACSCDDARPLFTSYDGYPFVDCLSCGSWYVPRVVDSALFLRFFHACPEAGLLAYTMTAERLDEARSSYDQSHFGELIDELLSLWPAEGARPRALLDVGCGVGHGLVAAQQRGLTAVGLESDADCVDLGRERLLDIRHVGSGWPDGPFDLIALWETLEHVSAPQDLLRGLMPSLAPGGLLTVLVPSLDSPSVRLQREDSSVVHGGINGPGHVNLFTSESLTQLLHRVGLTVLDMDGHFADNPIELAGYLLGRTRGAHDMLVGRRDTFALSDTAQAVLNAVWPTVALIERATLTAPILRVIACRASDVARFSGTVAALRDGRRVSLRRAVAERDTFRAPTLDWQPVPGTWSDLPPLSEWTPASGVELLGGSAAGLDVLGDDSPVGYQLTSPSVEVPPETHLGVFLPIVTFAGSVAIGVLGEDGTWIVPPTETPRPLTLHTGASTQVIVVVANLQPDRQNSERSRFRVQRGCSVQVFVADR